MPLFLVERNFSEQIQLGPEDFRQINQITDEIGAHWLSSFLSADGKKTYCLYEAKDTEHLREHAKVTGLPANEIVEVSQFWPQTGS